MSGCRRSSIGGCPRFVVAALALTAHAVMRPLREAMVVGMIWGVGTLFVVPAIAVDGGGPFRSIGGRPGCCAPAGDGALFGLFAIGLLFGLTVLACNFLLRAAAQIAPRRSAV